jgi:hypothetical protein
VTLLANQATTLESQPIHMIQLLSGRAHRESKVYFWRNSNILEFEYETVDGSAKGKLTPFVAIQKIDKNYFQQKQGAAAAIGMIIVGGAQEY